MLRRPPLASFRFWKLLGQAAHVLSAAPVSFRLACGDALGLEDIQLVRIITTRVHAQ